MQNLALQTVIQPVAVIGLGVAERAELLDSARERLLSADLIIGSTRQLATIESMLASARQCSSSQYKQPQQKSWQKLSELKTALKSALDQQQNVALLASGDPLFYGIGRWLQQQFDPEILEFFPAVSSLQMACHRLGCSLQDVEVVSLHGRPRASLRVHLQSSKRLLILTDQQSTPELLAAECVATGFDRSRISVCENLGYDDETISHWSAAELTESPRSFAELHVSLIQVAGAGDFLPKFPGIEDQHFITGQPDGRGMISKREVRIMILSQLQVGYGNIVWDIGAGCGSVAVEAAYWQPSATIYAIEQHPERLQYLAANRDKFGVVRNLSIIEGRAPVALTDLPRPDRIFIGGSDGELAGLLTLAWQQLSEDGLLVVSSVTDLTRQQLVAFSASLPSQSVSSVVVSIQRGKPRPLVNGSKTSASDKTELDYQSKLPVEIFTFKK